MELRVENEAKWYGFAITYKQRCIQWNPYLVDDWKYLYPLKNCKCKFIVQIIFLQYRKKARLDLALCTSLNSKSLSKLQHLLIIDIYVISHCVFYILFICWWIQHATCKQLLALSNCHIFFLLAHRWSQHIPKGYRFIQIQGICLFKCKILFLV